MTSEQNHSIVDSCIAEWGGGMIVSDYLDEYNQAHILISVAETVRLDQGKTWGEIEAFTLQEVKDGIPA